MGIMRTALSVIKADIGSIGGHIKPSHPFWDYVRDKVARLWSLGNKDFRALLCFLIVSWSMGELWKD